MKNKFIKNFSNFLTQGNIKELIIGFTVGVAFKDVVNSLVDNIIMPPIGLFLGNKNFQSLFINLSNQKAETLEQAEKLELPIIKYGVFLNEIVELLIIGLAIYAIVKIFFKEKSK